MKKFISVLCVVTLIVSLSISFMACKDNIEAEEVNVDNFDFTLKLQDYDVAPNSVNTANLTTKVKDTYDSNLAANNKAALMIYYAMENETKCEYYSYFNFKIGTTSLGDKSGTLLYQRYRKQSKEVKDDITLKLPINHNFGSIEQTFVTAADIRYIRNTNYYYRMQAASSMVYDETTGLINVANSDWKKKSGSKYWENPQTADSSMSMEEARKLCIDFQCEDILDNEFTTIVEKTTKDGAKYYSIETRINVSVANGNANSIDMLENDNGGSNMSYEYCNFSCDIWECGLVKSYRISEKWSGKIQIYEGAAESNSAIKYSYSSNDFNYDNTESILQGILNK